MKKFLSIFLAVTFLIGAVSVASFAQDYCNNLDTSSGIASYTGLDFSPKNNIWAKQEDGKWVSSNYVGYTYTDGESEFYGYYDKVNDEYYMLDESTGKFTKYTSDEFWEHEVYSNTWYISNNAYLSDYGTSYSDKLSWELSKDGEFITFESITGSTVPGIFFAIDEDMVDLKLGTTDNNQPEYLSVRLRNRSSASKFSFGWITNNTNSGMAFVTRTVSTFDMTPNSGEWVTYTFNMADLNASMNHSQNLNGGHAWNNFLKNLAIFPFGYDIDDGTGAYKSAEIDIDYIVIGSEDFCKNYKSELQKTEESVQSIKLVSAPSKTTYYVGDTLDLTGLQIEATYNDGTKETITDCSTNYDFTVENDEAVVTLKYGTSTTPLTYNVKVVGIEEISIDTPAKTTTFEVADVASGIPTSLIDGLTLKVKYNDGTEKTGVVPSVNNLELSGTVAGEQAVTINYYGAPAVSYTVNVVNVTSIKVADIEKTLYYNDVITLDDLTVTCVYSDGSEKNIADTDFSDLLQNLTFDTTVFGDIEVSVTLLNEVYGINATGTAKAKVETPESVVVDTLPAKTTYEPDETLDTEGMIVKFVYADGRKADVLAEDIEEINYDFSAPGTKTVELSVCGFTTSFDVTVDGTVAPPTPTNTTKPAQSSGGCGSVIGTSAMAVIAAAAAAGVVLLKKKEN